MVTVQPSLEEVIVVGGIVKLGDETIEGAVVGIT